MQISYFCCSFCLFVETFHFQDEDYCVDIFEAKEKLPDPESALLKIQKGINEIADQLDSQLTAREAKDLQRKSHTTPQKPSDMEPQDFTDTANKAIMQMLFPIARKGTVKIRV